MLDLSLGLPAITIGAIRKWQPALLDEAARTLLKHRDGLTSLQEEVTGSRPPASWRGGASDLAASEHGKIDTAAQRLTGEVAAVWRATLDAADSVEAVRRSLTEAENLAQHHGFAISDNGVIEHKNPPTGVPETERRAVELELQERVRELKRRANDIDDKLSRVLSMTRDDQLRTTGTLEQSALAGAQAGDLTVTPPPSANTAAANAAWWSSLSKADKDMVLTSQPDWIGNLDGVPAVDRNTANRARLRRMIAELEKEQEPASWTLTKLNALYRIDAELAKGEWREGNPPKPPIAPPRQLLMLDLENGAPKAAVATGNVDAAKHVVVQTSGITSSVEGSLALKQAEMDRLYNDGNGDVAAVTWLGYDPPQWWDVDKTFDDMKAKDGGEDLARFYQGINASPGGPADPNLTDPHLTAIGHSYGGVTTEYALTQEGTGVDDAVVYGTPGHPVDHVDQLHIPQDSFYTLSSDAVIDMNPPQGPMERGPAISITSPGDRVEDVGDAGALWWRGEIVGAQELDATGVNGHSEYLYPETTSYDNIRKVVLGEAETVKREQA